MIFAYADPPYLGCCKLYQHHHPDGRCWDDWATYKHLIHKLTEEYPDGWALSASAPSLRDILPMCPLNARIAPWCKSFGAFKRGVRPAYMWEPVIFVGGRNPPHTAHPPPAKNGQQTTPKDFYVGPITLKKGLTGAKPYDFCVWVLDLLNVQEGDTVVDLFPGTRVMETATVRRGAGVVRVLRGQLARPVLAMPEPPVSWG